MNTAVSALRNRLDPGSRALAAQDFRHASQLEREPTPDYIRRLEQLFRRAYGHEGMSDETSETLLHSQLQEGLGNELMKAPAVSGSHTYRELCPAARNEEKRLAELAKRRQYLKSQTVLEGGPGTMTAPAAAPRDPASQEWNGRNSQNRNPGPRRCSSVAGLTILPETVLTARVDKPTEERLTKFKPYLLCPACQGAREGIPYYLPSSLRTLKKTSKHDKCG